jgi:hypothetical protein
VSNIVQTPGSYLSSVKMEGSMQRRKNMQQRLLPKRLLISSALVLAGTICIFPVILSSTVARAQEASDRTQVERLAVAEDTLHAIFDSDGKFYRGFYSERKYRNTDGTVFAVYEKSATGNVHIWLRFGNGDLMFINDINERVARFLKGQAADQAV